MSEREGKLTKVDTGRWAIRYSDEKHDYDEITSGDVFELNILGVWHKVMMESSNGEYYSVPKFPLKDGPAVSQRIFARLLHASFCFFFEVPGDSFLKNWDMFLKSIPEDLGVDVVVIFMREKVSLVSYPVPFDSIVER